MIELPGGLMNQLPSLHTPRFSIIHYPDLEARMVADFEENIVTIQQPNRYGGTRVYAMDDYIDFEGGMRDFIKYKREEWKKKTR